MNAASTMTWRARNPEMARPSDWIHNGSPDPSCHMTTAFAEHLGFHEKTIRLVGTLQLCLCKSDEARRILLRSVSH